ncbi:MAG: thioesterase family protein [Alistipes sp.]|nr:thioesterase family protein [Alistipes sp.]
MLEKGLSATVHLTVTADKTALEIGSGDLAVFATPAMLAAMENAAMLAVADRLPQGSTTVGSEISASHIKPSPVGAAITATAVLTQVEERKLTFNVGASDNEGIIGEGTHVRFIVDRERFMARLTKNNQNIQNPK